MKTPALLAALLTATLLAGCGTAPTTAGLQKPAAVKAQSGWGQKTWATLIVSKDVMGHVLTQRDTLVAKFNKDFGDRKGFRLWMQLNLTASRDGFQTRQVSTREVLHTMTQAHALAFDFSGPAGEYAYYMTITANVIENDSAGNFRQVVKTYEPAFVSDFGKNFRAVAR